MTNLFLIVLGKLVAATSRFLNLGHGSTWPGHIALSLNKNFIKDILRNNRKPSIIIIAGTNGKTTTGKLIKTILEKEGHRVFQNEAGANLLNGIASSIVLHSSILSLHYDYVIFEVDENTLPLALKEIKPDFVILLNLFRDQLDRYGEVNTIAKKWQEALLKLPKKTTVILNADDPQIEYLGKIVKGKVFFFGLEDKTLHLKNYQHATDSTYCPNCGAKLVFDVIYFSHLGIWHCPRCQLKRPSLDLAKVDSYPLPGVYNQYNTHAAVLLAKLNNIDNVIIQQSLAEFKPAFGRQEILTVDKKRVQIFLSKNPTSFNESLRTVKTLGVKTILLVLNDRIPDGRDVSWIWDVDFEELDHKEINITISGDRCYDLGLRLKYASSSQIQNSKFKIQNYSVKFKIIEDLEKAIQDALLQTKGNETLYILPTYSAMLEVRRILTGRKIL